MYIWKIVNQRQQTVLNGQTSGFENVMVITFEVRDKEAPGAPVITVANIEVPMRLYQPDFVTTEIERVASAAYEVSRLGRG